MIEEIEDIKEYPRNIVPNPWRRFFARTFDISIYNIILTCIFIFILRWNTEGNSIAQLFELIISGFMMVFIEPLLLSTLGTTPGKWLFGLVVRDKNGYKISYSDGLNRTFSVFKNGMGFSIPFYNLYRQIKSHGLCTDQNEMQWDVGFTYRLKDKKAIRIFGYMGLWVVLVVVTVFISLQGMLPIHRGNITVEEYYENCNDFMSFNHMDLGRKINSSGEWVEKNNNSGMIHFISSTPAKHQVIYNNDEIQKVIIEIELSDDSFISNYGSQLLMGYVSLVGAEKSLSRKKLYNDSIMTYFLDSLSNFEFERGGFILSNEVEYSGYQKTQDYLIPNDNEEQYFHLRFTMERK